jgi:uncharacterized membrane protein
VGDHFGEASSYISGQITKGQVGPDGSYELNGLTPGADYVLYVDNLLSGAYSVPRILVLPGAEEYYNGAAESGDGLTDDRCAHTPIHVVAGAPVTADLVFNKVKGAPEFLPLPAVGIPSDITPDGGIVVGSAGRTAFKWTLADNAFTLIGGEGTGGSPAISDDGTKIAYSARLESGATAPAVYENGVWTVLPLVPGATTPCDGGWGSTFDISGDGSTVVGLSWGSGCANVGARGFYSRNGVTTALPKSPDSPTRASRANAVSYDGSLVVGWDDASTGARRGAYWHVAEDGTSGPANVLALMYPSMSFLGEALDVTRDGSQIVGQQATPVGGSVSTGWYYREDSGLGTYPTFPGTSGAAAATSDDAGVVGGWGNAFPTTRTPALWTADLGWANLNTLMNAQGTYAQDLVLANPTAISADGRTVTGWAFSIFGQVGWALKMPKAVVCHAPLDNPSNSRTLDVTFPDGLGEHLAHGDILGMCQHGGE